MGEGGFRLDEADHSVLEAYGVAMLMVQRFETSLGGLLDERKREGEEWLAADRSAAFGAWLGMPASDLARQLHLPRGIATDLQKLIRWRSRLAHIFLLEYVADRESRGDNAVDVARASLAELTLVFDRASSRILAVTRGLERGAPQRELSETWAGEDPVI